LSALLEFSGQEFSGQTGLVLRQGESARDRGWNIMDSKVPVPSGSCEEIGRRIKVATVA
jgi:hypothetical protein